MTLKFKLFLFASLFISSTYIYAQKGKINVDKVFNLAQKQYKSYILAYPDSTKYPRSTKEDGSIKLSPSHEWTSGFFGGSLWLLYDFTKDNFWKHNAVKWTESMEPEKNRKSTHDLGFMLYIPFGNGLRLTQNPHYKEVLVEASSTLSKRFNPAVGAIKSWDFKPYHYPVIVDNLMNLELLLWATQQTGDSSYYKVANTHAQTDLKYRFRPDNSSYHVLDFNPENGELIARKTHQGLADSSCWARGQAWAIYGYTMLYRFTHNTQYLNQAEKAADYFIAQVNTIHDAIPYWDFNDPKIPDVPRDASAAAIAASGMLELSKLSGDKKYHQQAEKMLKSLCSEKYLAKPGTNNFFLLKHSTGHKPGNSEIDVPIIYADYYFLEALMRYKNYN